MIGLEGKLQNQGQRTRVAREDLARLVKARIRRFQNGALEGGKGRGRLHVVQKSAHVLGMVEQVRRRSPNFQLKALVDAEALESGHVDVIDGRELQRVTSSGR
jgi:hypothetical protein